MKYSDYVSKLSIRYVLVDFSVDTSTYVVFKNALLKQQYSNKLMYSWHPVLTKSIQETYNCPFFFFTLYYFHAPHSNCQLHTLIKLKPLMLSAETASSPDHQPPTYYPYHLSVVTSPPASAPDIIVDVPHRLLDVVLLAIVSLAVAAAVETWSCVYHC